MGDFVSSDISLIVTTYRAPERLLWVLESVRWQTHKPKEVIVADDGSCVSTKHVVSEIREKLDVPLIHSWQSDTAFRLSRSRNLGASKATGDWLLFIDGDCVMPQDFIERQGDLSSARHLVFGSRKLLCRADTNKLLSVRPVLDLAHQLMVGRKFWKIPLGWFRSIPRRAWRNARGFHLAVSRRAFLSIHGFDESYVSWGLEDSDFVVRAIRSGLQLLDGRYATSLLHLYHAEKEADALSLNQGQFDAMIQAEEVLPSKSLFSKESY